MSNYTIHEQNLVAEFHRRFNGPTPNQPQLLDSRTQLRIDLILEEAFEFAQALGYQVTDVEYDEKNGGTKALLSRRVQKTGFASSAAIPPDFLESIDALCDLLYVVYGAAIEMGVDLGPFFDEVHAANMRKQNGGVRGDGKILKPEGWRPPDHERVFREVYGAEPETWEVAA